MLRKKGYFLLKYRIKKQNLNSIFLQKISSQDISTLCSNLGEMLGAGIPISEIFNIICGQNNKKIITESMSNIQENIKKGDTLYESIKKFSNIYPLFMIEMIGVGEESGKIEKIFKYLSEYYDKKYKLSNKIKTSISYPIMVLIISIFVIIFLMTTIVPEFINTLSSIQGNIPILTLVVLESFTFLKSKLYIIVTIMTLAAILINKMSKTSRGKEYIDRLKLKIPLVCNIYNKLLLSQIATSMALLMSAGLPIIKALDICSSIVKNRIVKKSIWNTIENIKSGESIYFSFKKAGIENLTFLNFIRIGEESGSLETMLFKVGNIFEYEINDNFKRIVTFIEPFAILILAMIIGTVVVATLLPLFNVMDSIG